MEYFPYLEALELSIWSGFPVGTMPPDVTRATVIPFRSASSMPDTLLADSTIRTVFLYGSRPGFSLYMAVMAGMPSGCSDEQMAPQAMPYHPALNAGPATTRSG